MFGDDMAVSSKMALTKWIMIFLSPLLTCGLLLTTGFWAHLVVVFLFEGASAWTS